MKEKFIYAYIHICICVYIYIHVYNPLPLVFKPTLFEKRFSGPKHVKDQFLQEKTTFEGAT